MFQSKFKFAASTMTMVLVLGLAACSAASIISYINEGLQIALEFLPLAVPGLPPAVTSYFTSGLQCVQVAADEMAVTTDSNAVKSTKITAQCAALVKADLPVGTPQRIVDLASKLATKIADILAHLPAPAPASAPGTVGVTAKASKPVFMKLKKGDVDKLHGIADKARAAQLQLSHKTDSGTGPTK